MKSTKKPDDPACMIPRPKGSVGVVGYKLMAEMGLDRTKAKEKMLYNNILVSEGPIRLQQTYIFCNLRLLFVRSWFQRALISILPIKTNP